MIHFVQRELSTFVSEITTFAWTLFTSRIFIRLLILLAIFDVLLIFLHLTYGLNSVLHFGPDLLNDPLLNISADGGYSEQYEYLKTFVTAIVIIRCYITARQPIYLALALVYSWILFDNMFQLHETIARSITIASPLASLLQIREQDVDELVIFGAVGAVAMIVLALGFAWSERAHRVAGAFSALLIVALGVVGAGLDLVHALFAQISYYAHAGLELLEDGGELLLISVNCAGNVALHAWIVKRAAGPPPLTSMAMP